MDACLPRQQQRRPLRENQISPPSPSPSPPLLRSFGLSVRCSPSPSLSHSRRRMRSSHTSNGHNGRGCATVFNKLGGAVHRFGDDSFPFSLRKWSVDAINLYYINTKFTTPIAKMSKSGLHSFPPAGKKTAGPRRRRTEGEGGGGGAALRIH